MARTNGTFGRAIRVTRFGDQTSVDYGSFSAPIAVAVMNSFTEPTLIYSKALKSEHSKSKETIFGYDLSEDCTKRRKKGSWEKEKGKHVDLLRLSPKDAPMSKRYDTHNRRIKENDPFSLENIRKTSGTILGLLHSI